MIRKLKHLLFLLLVFQYSAFSQQLSHEQGTFLIQLKPGTDIRAFAKRWTTFNNDLTSLKVEECLAPSLHIFKVSFNGKTVNEYRFLNTIRKDNDCLVAQFNHFVSSRQTVPNDGLFTNQWHHINLGGNGGIVDADMDTDLAWDYTTGGLTASGDTIVVAVLDDGVQLNHPDIFHNLWRNYQEIPNNGIDDDNNGYIDDFRGWNIATNSDDVEGGAHGTPVAGIIGASGNNGFGVSGINWNVKLMIVRNNFNTTEAAVITAYAYPLAMRTKWNESNGVEGAFVVATNASWGSDFGQPGDAPLWCAIYDELGEAGVISCGATANNNVNVDEDGDLPTACESDYLITVTNLKRNNIKETEAGYGLSTIDLGAFGTGVFTTGINGSYTAFGGTSGATPQVTGAVALLYSAPCPDLPDLYNSDPAATALLVKDYILDGVDQNNSLDNITLTGGRLNVFNSVQLAIDDCSPCFPPYNLSVTNLSTQTVTLSWTSPVDANNNTLRWRAIGSTNWNMEEGVNSPMDLSGLAVCTNYEFQVFSACDNGSSDYSPVVMFETDGCCKAPEAIEMNDIGLESAMITFTSVTAANSYNITITNQDTGEETTYSSSENTFLIELLESCTPYLVQIQSVCESGEITDYNEGVLFTTFGCGACTDLSYCPSNAEVSLYEWIANVSLNSLNNSSDNDNGYGNYTGLFTEVETYGTYPVSITPEFAGPSYDEYFKIWIDYNQDGDFEEENELAFDPLNPVSETISGEIVIPAEALPGLTRMRVTMKYIGAGDMDAPEACTVDFGFGEVEDYCIRIVEGAIPECDLPFNLDSIASAFNSVTLSWEDPTEDHENHNLRYRKLGTFEWTQLDNIDPPVVLSNLLFCTDYEAQVTANCVNGGSSGYTNILVFKTPCTINTETVLTTQLQIELFPNPVINKLIVSYELPEASDVDISLISLDGRRTNLLSNHFSQSGAQQITFERMDQFPAGLYWLELETEREVKYVKVLLSGIQ